MRKQDKAAENLLLFHHISSPGGAGLRSGNLLMDLTGAQISVYRRNCETVASGSEKMLRFELPEVDNPPFPRNFIRTAVCEIRFPYLASLGTETIPQVFSDSLRNTYPLYEPGILVFQDSPSLKPVVNHSFKSIERHWTVSLRALAVALETDAYVSFEDFYKRIEEILGKLLDHLDTSFFTRVGLRYINELPTQRTSIDGWVNKSLIGILADKNLGPVARYWTEVVGETDVNRFNLKFGFPTEEITNFVLDTDFYRENVESKSIQPTLDQLHKQSFMLFHWCLGKKAFEYLQER